MVSKGNLGLLGTAWDLLLFQQRKLGTSEQEFYSQGSAAGVSDLEPRHLEDHVN